MFFDINKSNFNLKRKVNLTKMAKIIQATFRYLLSRIFIIFYQNLKMFKGQKN